MVVLRARPQRTQQQLSQETTVVLSSRERAGCHASATCRRCAEETAQPAGASAAPEAEQLSATSSAIDAREIPERQSDAAEPARPGLRPATRSLLHAGPMSVLGPNGERCRALLVSREPRVDVVPLWTPAPTAEPPAGGAGHEAPLAASDDDDSAWSVPSHETAAALRDNASQRFNGQHMRPLAAIASRGTDVKAGVATVAAMPRHAAAGAPSHLRDAYAALAQPAAEPSWPRTAYDASRAGGAAAARVAPPRAAAAAEPSDLDAPTLERELALLGGSDSEADDAGGAVPPPALLFSGDTTECSQEVRNGAVAHNNGNVASLQRTRQAGHGRRDALASHERSRGRADGTGASVNLDGGATGGEAAAAWLETASARVEAALASLDVEERSASAAAAAPGSPHEAQRRGGACACDAPAGGTQQSGADASAPCGGCAPGEAASARTPRPQQRASIADAPRPGALAARDALTAVPRARMLASRWIRRTQQESPEEVVEKVSDSAAQQVKRGLRRLFIASLRFLGVARETQSAGESADAPEVRFPFPGNVFLIPDLSDTCPLKAHARHPRPT